MKSGMILAKVSRLGDRNELQLIRFFDCLVYTEGITRRMTTI
jgi:hypothetical protein